MSHTTYQVLTHICTSTLIVKEISLVWASCFITSLFYCWVQSSFICFTLSARYTDLLWRISVLTCVCSFFCCLPFNLLASQRRSGIGYQVVRWLAIQLASCLTATTSNSTVLAWSVWRVQHKRFEVRNACARYRRTVKKFLYFALVWIWVCAYLVVCTCVYVCVHVREHESKTSIRA